MTTRLSVNINAKTAHQLRGLRLEMGITYTEAVRRAIEVLVFFSEAKANGCEIHVIDPKNKTTREVITL